MPAIQISAKEIRKVARERLGFEELRPGQLQAVESVLEGHDTLVVQPTGSGKSAIYQIAGLLIDGATVIVSPLIALHKDQVYAISQQDSAPALALNSTQRDSEARDTLQQVAEGSIEYIFLAPEQLRKEETVDRLSAAGVSLFVVDEAHCISQWGHDFRPDYLRLARVIESLGHPRVIAMTATASGVVREEIVRRLGMQRPKIFVQGFDRPNIFLRVDHFEMEEEKRDALVHKALWADKPGIIYTGTRRSAEDIVARLAEEGTEAIFYHAGLGRKQRESAHERFMSAQVGVIVATNAFGMGIDKADIRFVYHYDPPESLDSYYQEIGRAGRDGERSDAILFYRHQNIGAQSFKTGEGAIPPARLEALANRIAKESEPIAPVDIAGEIGLSQRRITTAIQRLEDAGAIRILAQGQVVAVRNADLHEAVMKADREQNRRREAKRERLREMQDYAESAGCRRELLLQHLGDEFHGPCGFCDNCEGLAEGVLENAEGTRREVV